MLRAAVVRSAESALTDGARAVAKLPEPALNAHLENGRLPESVESAAPGMNLRHNAGGSYCEGSYYTKVVEGYYGTRPSPYTYNTPLGASSSSGFQVSSVFDHRTGSITRSYGNSSFMRTSVCALKGQILLTVKRGSGVLEVQVPQGTSRWATFWGGGGCEIFDTCGNTESKVTEASGDEYHYRYQVQSG
jgi:hypothetical protein